MARRRIKALCPEDAVEAIYILKYFLKEYGVQADRIDDAYLRSVDNAIAKKFRPDLDGCDRAAYDDERLRLEHIRCLQQAFGRGFKPEEVALLIGDCKDFRFPVVIHDDAVRQALHCDYAERQPQLFVQAKGKRVYGPATFCVPGRWAEGDPVRLWDGKGGNDHVAWQLSPSPVVLKRVERDQKKTTLTYQLEEQHAFRQVMVCLASNGGDIGRAIQETMAGVADWDCSSRIDEARQDLTERYKQYEARSGVKALGWASAVGASICLAGLSYGHAAVLAVLACAALKATWDDALSRPEEPKLYGRSRELQKRFLVCGVAPAMAITLAAFVSSWLLWSGSILVGVFAFLAAHPWPKIVDSLAAPTPSPPMEKEKQEAQWWLLGAIGFVGVSFSAASNAGVWDGFWQDDLAGKSSRVWFYVSRSASLLFEFGAWWFGTLLGIFLVLVGGLLTVTFVSWVIKRNMR